MVGQPLPAHRAEVAQELPRIAATSPAMSEKGTPGNDECEEDGQND